MTERIRGWINQYDGTTDPQATLAEFAALRAVTDDEVEMLYLETLIGLCRYDLGQRYLAGVQFQSVTPLATAMAQKNKRLTLLLAWYGVCMTLEAYSALAASAPNMAVGETDSIILTFELIARVFEGMQDQYYLGLARSILAELAVRKGDRRQAVTEAQLSTTALTEFGSDPDARAHIRLDVNQRIIESNGARATLPGDDSTEPTDWSVLTYVSGELLDTLPDEA